MQESKFKRAVIDEGESSLDPDAISAALEDLAVQEGLDLLGHKVHAGDDGAVHVIDSRADVLN